MKKFKIFLMVLGVIAILGIIFFIIDYNRVKKQEKPIFCIEVGGYLDGGTCEYLGILYKVIDFHTLKGYDDIKIGTWFMDYSDFDEEREKYEEHSNWEEEKLIK